MSEHPRRCAHYSWLAFTAAVALIVLTAFASADGRSQKQLDQQLSEALQKAGFTGEIQSKFGELLGRPINPSLAGIGRKLWFDTITGLNDDNTCGGCHSPTAGFGDTQSIAIGIDNNGIVGPHREGPRNQRRTPMAINTALYPALMWNSRFRALSGNPFDNSLGFLFPPPEGLSLSYQPHLLTAQAFIPPTERTEVAGFQFVGGNDDIRNEVLRRLNATPAYRKLFGNVFEEVRRGQPITFDMFGRAIAEFEFTLVFADAPIDRFARGKRNAMTDAEKRGALLFFGKAGCVSCHAVSGKSNEMFSDFDMHVIGVPQIAPSDSNVVFDGPGQNEDFGLEQVSQLSADRYRFRTSPLRNAALQPAFFHNGSFLSLDVAVRHHLDAVTSARNYSPVGLAADCQGPMGPIEPVLERLDSRIANPPHLVESEIQDLVTFVRDSLLDSRARPENLRKLIPARVPSGRATLQFE